VTGLIDVILTYVSIGLTKAHGIWVYPGSGCADGTNGDHIIMAPAFNITHDEVDLIVNRVSKLVEDFFDEYDKSHVKNP
jgi:adenosylmethionine-8-amino-7-oxononanoate aminotransferase